MAACDSSPAFQHQYPCQPRAGGLYRPDASTEPQLAQLPPEAKGDLSYGIYQHNRRYRLFDRLWRLVGPGRGHPEVVDVVLAHQPLDLDAKHLEYLLAQRPTTEARILGYMQELVRQQAQARPNLIALPTNGETMDLLQAAPAALATLSIPSGWRLIWIVVLVVVGGLAVQIGAIVLQHRPWQAWRRRRGWPVRESLDIAPRPGPRG